MHIPHPNRRAHNWIVYRAIDHWLGNNTHAISGDVVDLGAGEAPYRAFFVSHANSYRTVDWANSQHRIAVDVIADLNAPLPLADSSADVAVSISVLEHLRRPDRFLSEVARILRPGRTTAASSALAMDDPRSTTRLLPLQPIRTSSDA